MPSACRETGKAGGPGFVVGETESRSKLWKPRAMSAVVGSSTLGAVRVERKSSWPCRASAYFNCTNLGKLSFSNCCIHFIFNVIPF